MARKRLGEILIEAGLIDEQKLQAGLAEQRRWGGQLGRVMVDRGLITEEALIRALAQQFRIPIVDLGKTRIAMDALNVVSLEMAQQFNVLPIKLEGKFLDLAMSDPTNLGIIDEIRIRTQLDVQPYLAGPRAIETAIRHFYQVPDPARTTLSGLATQAAATRPRRTAGAMPVVGSSPSSSGQPAAHRTGDASSQTDGRHGGERELEIRSLQRRVAFLEGLLQRDEHVIRQVCIILIESNIVTREEMVKRLGR